MIAVGCDHGGFPLKKEVIKLLAEMGLKYEDFGTFSEESCDYPVFAQAVAQAVQSGRCERGILICGTGIGVSMVANRFAGVRAALCGDSFSARAAREHNDANILTLGARVTGPGLALDIVKIFLATEFSGDARHVRRLEMFDQR